MTQRRNDWVCGRRRRIDGLIDFPFSISPISVRRLGFPERAAHVLQLLQVLLSSQFLIPQYSIAQVLTFHTFETEMIHKSELDALISISGAPMRTA